MSADRPIPLVTNLRGAVTAPSSKSVTQRALIAASMVRGRSRLRNPLLAGDSRALLTALDQIGIPSRITASGEETAVEVEGDGGATRGAGRTLQAGNAGTTMRFLTARLALGREATVIDGDARMRQRPIEDLLQALRDLGAAAFAVNGDGCPPVRVGGQGLAGGRIQMRGSLSSQFLSAILLAAPAAATGVEVGIVGDLVSRPYVDLTIDVMRRFGVKVIQAPASEAAPRITVPAGQHYRPIDLVIEGDYSSASYFFAAAAITSGSVRVDGLNPDSRQGDARFLELLQRMGCVVEKGERSVTVSASGALRGIDADLRDCPDIAPTLAMVALFASGPTRITGAHHLRLKESDRIAALAAEIRRLGGTATPTDDGLTIIPAALTGAHVETYGDHRMAMSFAVAGLRVPGVVIRDPGCVVKSFPAFWDRFDRLVAR